MGDLNRETVGMVASEAAVAALGCLASPEMEPLWHERGKAGLDVPDVLGLCSQGDVVVNELSPGHQQDCDSMVMEALVLEQAGNYRQT